MPDKKPRTVSKPQGPHDVVGEGLLQLESIECDSHDGRSGGGMSGCLWGAYLAMALENRRPLGPSRGPSGPRR